MDDAREPSNAAGPDLPRPADHEVGVRSTVSHRMFSVRTWPLGSFQAEVGYVKVNEAGLINIKFRQSFQNTPALLMTSHGYISILGIKVPLPVFTFKATRTGFSLFSFATDGWVSYLAWEL